MHKTLVFKEQISEVVRKAQKVITALTRIILNLGGLKERRRQLLVSVVQSVLLHRAPVWAFTLKYSKSNVEALMKVQCRAALRKVCTYKTVSYDAINVIASLSPIDLLVVER